MRCLNCSREGVTTETVVCPGCGVYLPSLTRELLPPGTLLHGGKYRIEYALGRGGFGVTYVARHVSLEQEVAVKEFFPRDLASRDTTTGRVGVARPHEEAFRRSLRRFVREGQTLALVSHPSVVRVRDQFEELDTAYLVMDLISPARTLREELDAQKDRRLAPERAETIMGELADALEAVHRAGVFHLDIKPDNILLTPTGRPILVDFGASRRGLSSQSTQAFTLEYAAPEVLAGEDVGPESDLFELGMVFHEVLTGERPPTAMSRLLKSEWQPALLEAPWAGMIAGALRLKKEERPPSVAEWWRAGLSTLKQKPARKRAAKTKSGPNEEQKSATLQGAATTTHEQQQPTGTKAKRARPTERQDANTSPQQGEIASDAAPHKARDVSPHVVERVKEFLKNGSKIRAIEFYRSATGVGLKEAKEYVEGLERKSYSHASSEVAPVIKNPPLTIKKDPARPAEPTPKPSAPLAAPQASSGGVFGTLLGIVIIAASVIYFYPRLFGGGANNRPALPLSNSISEIGLPVPKPETIKPSQNANYAAAPPSAAFATRYCGPVAAPVRETPAMNARIVMQCYCGTEVSIISVTETLDFTTGGVLQRWAEIRIPGLMGESYTGWILVSSLAEKNPC